MTKEHEQLTRMLSGGETATEGSFRFVSGRLGRNEIVLMQCGIGKVNAAVGAALLIHRYAPDCVVSTGCAGGIEAGMQVMDVVVSTSVAHHDVVIPGCETGQVQGLPARFRSDEQLVEMAMERHEREGVTFHAGLIVSGDQFISDQAQLRRIKAAFPEAVAVDMESAAIAQTCHLLRVPFVSFRVLSDTPGADGHLEQYFNFWDTMAERSFEVTRCFLASLPERFALLPFADAPQS